MAKLKPAKGRAVDPFKAAERKVKKAGVPTEKQMRDAEVPRMDSLADLTNYVWGLADRPHDYGTCVYAMSMAAHAAYRYIANHLGVSGFQASMADLDFLRRARGIEGPFMLVTADKLLYPQYEPLLEVEEWLNGSSTRQWAKKEAQKLLAEQGKFARPSVVARWRELVKVEVPKEKGQ